jgi:hypothetical protein
MQNRISVPYLAAINMTSWDAWITDFGLFHAPPPQIHTEPLHIGAEVARWHRFVRGAGGAHAPGTVPWREGRRVSQFP